jgi:hypothetical protein
MRRATAPQRDGHHVTDTNEDPNPDTLPNKSDPSGKCPRCGRVANFDTVRSEALRGGSIGNTHGTTEWVTVLACHGCHEKSVVVDVAHSLHDASRGFAYHGVMWWPTDHLGDLEQVAGVPQDIVTAYSEGVRCLAVQAPNAAVAMFRTVLAHIVEDKGSPAAKATGSLFGRIEQMVQDRTLWDDFGDWAHHVRDTGNAGAHGEKFDPVAMDQATDLQKFIRAMLDFLYVQPARRAAARAATKRANPPTSGGTTPPGASGTSPGSGQT